MLHARRFVRLSLAGAATLVLGLCAACRGSACGDVTGASGDICAPPPLGYATVEGTVTRANGGPGHRLDVRAACGDVVGLYHDSTDAQGRFRMTPVYGSLPDTTLVPLPPRDSIGRFTIRCRVAVVAAREVIIDRDSVAVEFAPTRALVRPTQLVLTEGGR